MLCLCILLCSLMGLYESVQPRASCLDGAKLNSDERTCQGRNGMDHIGAAVALSNIHFLLPPPCPLRGPNLLPVSSTPCPTVGLPSVVEVAGPSCVCSGNSNMASRHLQHLHFWTRIFTTVFCCHKYPGKFEFDLYLGLI